MINWCFFFINGYNCFLPARPALIVSREMMAKKAAAMVITFPSFGFSSKC